MNLIERGKSILLTPKQEWSTIAGEATTTQELYTFYLGVTAMKKVPQEKAVTYTVVVVVCVLVLGAVIGGVMRMTTYGGMPMGM